jgi:hypothetical protein
MLAAQHDATKRSLSIRDEARAEAVDFGRLVASWVDERAGPPTGRASHEAALRAVRVDPTSNWLTADLHRFIDSYLDGSLTGEQFVRMLKKPLLRATSALLTITTRQPTSATIRLSDV